MTKPQIEIALGIVVEDDNVLVIERQQREIGRSGKPIIWAFPGGKLEHLETPQQAAVREVEEETGYQVQAQQIITAENHPQYPVFVHYVGCKLLGRAAVGELPPTIVNTDWTPAACINELFTWPINEKVQGYIQAQVQC